MKLSLFAIAIFLLAGCSKRDIIRWTQKSRCDVAEQTLIWNTGKSEQVEQLVKKTFYANGLPKSFKVVLRGIFAAYDSLDCTFDYGTNSATVHVKSNRYVDYESPSGYSNTSFDLQVQFDPQTGNVTKIGNDLVLYENKKVKQFGTLKFYYDGYGNLDKIYRIENQGVGLRFTYALNKKAGKQEFYTASPMEYGRNFCIAELMSWLPLQSPYRRIARENSSPEYVYQSESYSNHQYKDGKLTQFDFTRRDGYLEIVKNSWNCLK